MKIMNKLFYVLYLVTISIGHIVDGENETTIKEEIQSNLIKKSPIKSIHSKSGNIIDCIDINKQPTFDNLLLKNHKLQRKPSFETSLKVTPTKSVAALEKVECPKGYVPILRMNKDNLTQDKFLFNQHILDTTNRRIYSAQAYVKANFSYGASGNAAVYNPRVANGQMSGSALYVQGGMEKNTSQIVFGWHVSPELYNDDASHVFASWTSNNFTSGCYNTICPGFVQTDHSYYLGQSIKNTSMYESKVKFEMTISISQDVKTNNWWLSLENKTIGYFPAKIFSNLMAAEQVGWGGFVVNNAGKGISSPPMGTGHFDERNLIHTSYIDHIQYLNGTRKQECPMYNLVERSNNAPKKCYNTEYYGEQIGFKENGCFILFGGPGGDCDK